MKKILRILIVCFAMLSLVACGSGGNKKIVGVGEKRSTAFFDFSIESIEVVDKYAGQEAIDGFKIVDFVIYTKNTMNMMVPMFDTDYVIIYNGEEYWPELALDDTMAPEEVLLQVGEDMTYHYVFVIPNDAMKFDLTFEEIFETGAHGEIHTIKIELNK